MSYFLLPIRDKKDVHLFFGGFVIGSIVEYVFHFGQSYLFNSYSWNYSAKVLNVNGRIDLFHSICWGILAIVWIRKTYPWLEKNIDKIKPKLNIVLTIVLGIFMIVDIAISSVAVERWSERVQGIDANNEVEKFLDKHYNDKYLEKIYPNMKMIDKN